MNSYELYLKKTLTQKEFKTREKIQNHFNITKSKGFKNKKEIVIFLLIVSLAISLFYIMIIHNEAKKQKINLTIDVLFNLNPNIISLIFYIFMTMSVIFLFLTLVLFTYEQIVKSNYLKFKTKLNIDKIIQKPDFLSFLQNQIQEHFNFDIQSNFVKDFENVGNKNEINNIISFIAKYSDNGKLGDYFLSFSKEVYHQKKNYYFNTEKDFLNNKYILIKLLALINLNKLEEEKMKNLSEDLKEKVEFLKTKKEKEDFFNSFKTKTS